MKSIEFQADRATRSTGNRIRKMSEMDKRFIHLTHYQCTTTALVGAQRGPRSSAGREGAPTGIH